MKISIILVFVGLTVMASAYRLRRPDEGVYINAQMKK